jgi:hypothetical protein
VIVEYKLKKVETWEDEAELHPPKFCPNCGTKLDKRPIQYWCDSNRPSTQDDSFRGVGYDTFCDKCDWRGNIAPDSDMYVIQKRLRSR